MGVDCFVQLTLLVKSLTFRQLMIQGKEPEKVSMDREMIFE